MAVSDDNKHWTQESFEDAIMSVLLVHLDDPPKSRRIEACSKRAGRQDLTRLARSTPYIPGGDRFYLQEHDAAGHLQIDTALEHVSDQVTVALPGDCAEIAGTYARIMQVRRVPKPDKPYNIVGPGLVYKVVVLHGRDRGSVLLQRFVTIDGAGVIRACRWRITGRGPDYAGGKGYDETPAHECQRTEQAVWAAQMIGSDARHVWKIRAEEEAGAVRVGCTPEEVKSLLYARTLPTTATGRKRPILHLVAAHRRRLREGIDIDVRSHLRGLQPVEFGGTRFQVQPPPAIRNSLTEHSQRYYAPAPEPAKA